VTTDPRICEVCGVSGAPQRMDYELGRKRYLCVGCKDAPPDGAEWKSRHPDIGEFYSLGKTVTWRGVELVCTLAHHCGGAAVHPWDPGWGWPTSKAATLWAPNGDVEAAKLLAVVDVIGADDALAGEHERLTAIARELTVTEAL
jgi:hypothetical protein